MSYDPIFYADTPFGDYDWGFTSPGWYYWDETEVYANGPYETRDDALEALRDYARYLGEGHDADCPHGLMRPTAVSAPASGAPDEEDGNREVKMLLAENVNLRTRLAAAEKFHERERTDMLCALEAASERLAAAERAGVALREALRTYGDHKAYCESTYGPPGVGDCTCGLDAALTPTSPAPSPEERANG